MTATQYRNTVADLLAIDVDPTTFPASERGNEGFSTDAQANVTSEIGVEFIMHAAESVAALATADLSRLLPCTVEQLDDTCIGDFIETFGARAYRRPLTDDEVSMLHTLVGRAPSDATAAERVGMLLEAILQSPQFLYVTQGGGVPAEWTTSTGAPLERLSDWELASKLSYFLWDTMPDDALFEAAAAGELRTDEQLESEVRRMLDDPRALPVLWRFHEEWLRIENIRTTPKSAVTYPDFDVVLATSMAEETRRFVLDALAERRPFVELLLGRSTWMNQPLAAFYGVASESTGAQDWVRATYPAERMGLLMQGSVLAVHADRGGSNPVKRGAFIQHEIMCLEIPPPPPGIPPLGDAAAGQTKREVLEAHREDPACRGCHVLLDPPGLALEHYDGIGAWRQTENGAPIDASGELVSGGGALGAFDDAVGMVELLAGTDEVERCYAQQWFHYATGRPPTEADETNLALFGDAFVDDGGDIHELLVRISTAPSFRYRIWEEE